MTHDSRILVANLGSTSFKFRLFDMAAGRQLARGASLCDVAGSPTGQDA